MPTYNDFRQPPENVSKHYFVKKELFGLKPEKIQKMIDETAKKINVQMKALKQKKLSKNQKKLNEEYKEELDNVKVAYGLKIYKKF
jgi:TRAP-type mannitol/chloroaromatic compound transport system substrate-binding protein